MSEKHLEIQSQLLDAAIGGDTAALEKLIAANHVRLKCLVERLFPPGLLHWLEPDDILQETYTAAFCSIATFEPRGEEPFFRWLATIARCRIIDQARSAKRFEGQGEKLEECDRVLSDVLDQAAVYKRTPSQSAAGHELFAMVERSIGQLPEEQQEALRLRHEEGLSPTETAQRMQRGVGAAQMVYFRALRNLREKIGPASLYV